MNTYLPTITTRTGATLLQDGKGVEPLRVLCNHPAPDTLTVSYGMKTESGAEYLSDYDGATIRELRNEWDRERAADLVLEQAIA